MVTALYNISVWVPYVLLYVCYECVLCEQDLRGAFYKFDADHKGYLTKQNFRRMLDSFMCIMSDEEFELLCQK